MAIDWKDPEVKDRLLAAIIASFDNKINCKEVARIFGEGATYNAIENFLRKPKKEAAEMKARAAGTASPAPSPARLRAPRTPKTPKTPKGATGGVKTGRVTKNKKATVNKSAVMSEGTGSDSDGEGRDENEETKVDHTATPAMFKEEQEDDDYV